MNISLTSKVIVDERRPESGFDVLKENGVDSLLWSIDLWTKNYDVKSIIEIAKNKGITVPAVCIDSTIRDLRWKAEECKTFLKYFIPEIAETTVDGDFDYYVISPMNYETSLQQVEEYNECVFSAIAKTIKDTSKKILIKTAAKQFNGHFIRSFLSEADELAGWIDEQNQKYGRELFGACVDVGTCNLLGMDTNEYIKKLGKRVKMVIIRDTDGVHDDSALPFLQKANGSPNTNWLEVIRGLRAVEFDGEMVLDTVGVFSSLPPMLRNSILPVAKRIIEYFGWQVQIENHIKKYPKRVLFGAGNMCRNYMKNYGKDYPPLFTCDNNRSRWGEKFCGLEIRSPEALTDLPEDCAIFICNVYYTEIEAQLRNMGIKNPITYFNDEYMPTFDYDRLEMF